VKKLKNYALTKKKFGRASCIIGVNTVPYFGVQKDFKAEMQINDLSFIVIKLIGGIFYVVLYCLPLALLTWISDYIFRPYYLL